MLRVLCLLVVGLALLAVPCAAQQHLAKFTLPFAFECQSKTLPAGAYTLTITENTAELRDANTQRLDAMVIAARFRPMSDNSATGHLHFVMDRGTYYLHHMELDAHGAHLLMPKQVDALVARRSAAVKTVTVVAD